MGSKYRVCLAVGVLLVVSAPLVFADGGKTLPARPDPSGANEAAEDAQRDAATAAADAKSEVERGLHDGAEAASGAAEAGASRAQDGASQLQSQASHSKHRVLQATEEAATKTAAALTLILEKVTQTAVEAVGTLLALARDLPPLHPPVDDVAPSEADGAPLSTAALGAAVMPLADPAVAGVAMVVAAGAVGAALLWWTVLQRAVLFGALPLLSRIAHSEIYENGARRLIAEMATSSPGLCLNEVVAKTGYSRNAVSYHLFVLEKEGEVVSIKDGKYRRYFPRGGKYVNGAKNVVSALRNDTTLRMAQHIVLNPGTIQRELCKVLGTTASAACWHAKRLEDLHVIRKERVANTVQYYPGEALLKYDLAEFGLRPIAAPAPVTLATAPPAPAPSPGALPA